MGLFDNSLKNKNNSTIDQSSIDYVRINLLAKLGEDNVETGNYRGAINYIHEFFELVNKNTFPDIQHLIQPCYFNIALSFSNCEEHDNAIKYWTMFIQTDNKNFDAYFERCQSYFAVNKINEAIADTDSALKLKPTRGDLYINKGIGYIHLGNKIEARIALSKAVEFGNPDAQNFINKYC